MRHSRAVAIAVLCLVLVPAAFAADDQKNIIRGGLFLSRPTGNLEGIGITLEPQKSFGFQVAYERKLLKTLGVTLGVGTIKYDIDAKIDSLPFRGKFAEVNVLPVTAAVLYHPIPERTADFYVGGGPAYIHYDKSHVEPGFGGTEIRGDNDFTWFFETGIDIRLDDAGKWRGNVDLRYVQTSIEDLDFDPINLGMGLSYRF